LILKSETMISVANVSKLFIASK